MKVRITEDEVGAETRTRLGTEVGKEEDVKGVEAVA
jgi:hypothetical protein